MASSRHLELQVLSTETLKEELTQAKASLVQAKFDHNSKGSQDLIELHGLRKEVARLQTEIRAREIKAMSPEELAKRSRIRLRRK